MNKADEIRDKIRQLRYLMEERKFIDDLIHKLDEQKNRLHLEELSLQSILNENRQHRELSEYGEPAGEEPVIDEENAYLLSGTPSRPIEAPAVASLELNSDRKQPKAVVEPIDLDVRKVLLKLASGGHQEEEEEFEDDE